MSYADKEKWRAYEIANRVVIESDDGMLVINGEGIVLPKDTNVQRVVHGVRAAVTDLIERVRGER